MTYSFEEINFNVKYISEDGTIPPVIPLDVYLPSLKSKHRLLINSINEQDNLTIDEKYQLYDEEVVKLRTSFEVTRNLEYSRIRVKQQADHSCTKGSSGGTKNCGWKYVNSPGDNMVTDRSTFYVSIAVSETIINDTNAGIRLQRSGKGRTYAIFSIYYVYSQADINGRVSNEWINLYNNMVKNEPPIE